MNLYIILHVLSESRSSSFFRYCVKLQNVHFFLLFFINNYLRVCRIVQIPHHINRYHKFETLLRHCPICTVFDDMMTNIYIFRLVMHISNICWYTTNYNIVDNTLLARNFLDILQFRSFGRIALASDSFSSLNTTFL